MSYIDQSLIPGETVLHRARLTWWSQAALIVLGIVLLVVVIGLVFLVMAWINMKSTEIAITNKRIIAKFGFIRRNTVEISLDKVEALRVEQGVWGRFLNYGTILISGVGSTIDPIRNIADPLVFRRKFMEATDRPITMPRQ
ncbi:MAG TPA: PH domain-containing protein [Usitatibacter sp.]|nr:PH domain-containing protein [Usitatibacter sp.]